MRCIVLIGPLAILLFLVAACSNGTPSAPDAPPPSEEATPTVAPTSTVILGPLGPQRTPPSLLSAPVNACIYHAPEPTPTPTPTTDLTTPTATPFSNTTPIPYPTEIPSAEVVAYPDLPPPALPASVEAWRDAVVRVSVERGERPPSGPAGASRFRWRCAHRA